MPMKSYPERRAILVAITAVGKTASLPEIEAALPSDRSFAKKRTALRQMLNLMEWEGLVMRLPTGSYLGTCGSGWGGLGTDNQIVHSISACLRECNGVMRLDDVLRDFVDQRIWSPDERQGQSLLIQEIISKATCLRQNGEHVSLISERPPGFVAPPVPYALTAPGQVPHGGCPTGCLNPLQ